MCNEQIDILDATMQYGGQANISHHFPYTYGDDFKIFQTRVALPCYNELDQQTWVLKRGGAEQLFQNE